MVPFDSTGTLSASSPSAEWIFVGLASLSFAVACAWYARSGTRVIPSSSELHPPFSSLSSSFSSSFFKSLPLYRTLYHWVWPASQLRRTITFLLCIAFAILVVRGLLSLSVRKMQTGSLLRHEYEWYGFEASAARLHPGLSPRDHSDECLAPDLVDPPPHMPALRRVIDPSLRPPHEPKQVRVVHVLQMTENDLFPFLWESILGQEDTYDEEQQHLVARGGADDGDDKRRWFRQLGIDLVLVEPTPDKVLDMLADKQHQESALAVRNVLLVGSHYERTFLARLPQGLPVGVVMLGSEYCRNGLPPNGSEGADLRFTFLTYGDCSVVDNRQFFAWPLGPSGFHGLLPRGERSSAIVPADRRPLLLNLMVSITPRKPTRMQALLVAEQICSQVRGGSKRCLLGQTNWLLKLTQWFGREVLQPWLGIDLPHHSASSSTNSYSQTLLQSRLTLCPSGNSPEQYRIWEAIIAGSIPVIEDPPFEQGQSVHPAFGDRYGCQSADIHRFLKETNAPVYLVQDWQKDLPKIIREIEDDPQVLLERQQKLMVWFRAFRTHLRIILLEAILRHMEPD